nr:MAG: Px protein [Sobemovirus sp.]
MDSVRSGRGYQAYTSTRKALFEYSLGRIFCCVSHKEDVRVNGQSGCADKPSMAAIPGPRVQDGRQGLVSLPDGDDPDPGVATAVRLARMASNLSGKGAGSSGRLLG